MPTQYFFIYSKNRSNGVPEEFEYYFENDVTFNAVAIQLVSAIIPNYTYNVESGYNSLVVRELSTDGVTVLTELSTTIAPGNYTDSTFKTAMNTAIGAVFDGTSGKGTFTLDSYNSATGKWTWTYSAGSGAGYIQLRVSADNTRDISRLSGYGDPRPIDNITNPPGTFESLNAARFSGIHFFRPRVQPLQLRCYNTQYGAKSDVLAIIPASNYNEITYYDSDGGSSDMIELEYPMEMSSLYIRLEDDDGNRVDLHGGEIHYTFKIYYGDNAISDAL